MALIWFRIEASGWVLTVPLILHFILRLTKNKVFAKHPWLFILLYIPAPYFTYGTIVEMNIIPDVFMSSVGWALATKRDIFPWTLLNNIYTMTTIISIPLLIHWGKTSNNPVHKKQSVIITLSFFLSILFFILIPILPSLLHISPLLNLDQFSVLFWQLGMGYAILRYKLMILSPGDAAKAVIDTMADGVLLVESNGIIVDFNASILNILKIPADRLYRKYIDSALPNMVSFQNIRKTLKKTGIIRDMEVSYKTDTKYEIYISLSASLIKDRFKNQNGIVIVLRDITERKQTENQLHHMATHDVLTNLPNRIVLNDRLRHALASAQRYNFIIAVLLIDIDKFKDINDLYGHDAGDLILKKTANRLSGNVRECDTVSRFGGDEFMILLTNLTDRETCINIIKRIHSSFISPIKIGKNEIHVTISIGISMYPRNSNNIEDLFKFADIALYNVKSTGRNGYKFYSPDIESIPHRKVRLEQELQSAIDKNEFTLHYQPIFEIRSAKIIALESLIRWKHPDLGCIQPLDFILLAERCGLILPIGEWVLYSVCRQLREWMDAGLPPIPITINFSIKQFHDPQLFAKINNALMKYKLEPHMIGIEITESVAVAEIEKTIENIRKLEEIGIPIIIDDFGSGYSSMVWLKHLKVHTIKIDQFFIQNITQDKNDAAIVKAIISMAHSMGIRVIAEGIESGEQLTLLQSMSWDNPVDCNCDYGQGFYFSKPLDARLVSELFVQKKVPV